MVQVTSREFRDKQASLFKLADSGEQVVIKRRGKVSYMLTPVHDSDFVVTPELERKIEKARQDFREGKTISCRTKEELHNFLESL